jgi:adenylate kinase
VPHISTGDTLRQAIRSGSELGREARRYLDSGDLVPDEIVIGMVRERLTRSDTSPRRVLNIVPSAPT